MVSPEQFLAQHAQGGTSLPLKDGTELAPTSVEYVEGEPAVSAVHCLPDGRELVRVVYLGGVERWTLDGEPALNLTAEIEMEPGSLN